MIRILILALLALCGVLSLVCLWLGSPPGDDE